MSALYDLKEMLICEMEEYGERGELNASTLGVIDTLAHAAKNVCKVIDYYEDGYSKRMSARASYRGMATKPKQKDSNSMVIAELETIKQMATDEQTKTMIHDLITKIG